MARILCNVAGGGKPLKGNAETGDVLAGKTFSNKQSNALTGSMPNNGAWSASTSGNGSVTIPAGYHNGSGTVSGAASYNSGYANGYSAGKSVAAAKITNIKVSGGKTGQEDVDSKAQGCSSDGYFTIDVSNYSSVVIGNCTIQRADSYVEATLKITTDVGTLLSLSTSGSGTKTGGNVTKALSGASTLKVQITPAVYSNRKSTSSSYGSISSLTFLV